MSEGEVVKVCVVMDFNTMQTVPTPTYVSFACLP